MENLLGSAHLEDEEDFETIIPTRKEINYTSLNSETAKSTCRMNLWLANYIRILKIHGTFVV
jgi:hypothetical protein